MNIDLFEVKLNRDQTNSYDIWNESFVSQINLETLPRIGEHIYLYTESRQGCSFNDIANLERRVYKIMDVIYVVKQCVARQHLPSSDIAVFASLENF